MNERVKLIRGNEPTILVCPHINIDLISMAKDLAKTLDCYAVINQGFAKSDSVNLKNSEADCYKIDQLKNPVVNDEFLKPLLKYKENCIKKHGWCMIYYLFSTNEDVSNLAGESVGLIIGNGRGKKYDSKTCKGWRKHLFVNVWRDLKSKEIFEGKGSGAYSGRNANELNQYFRKIQRNMLVESLEVHIPECGIKNGTARKNLYCAMSDMMLYDYYDKEPVSKFI